MGWKASSGSRSRSSGLTSLSIDAAVGRVAEEVEAMEEAEAVDEEEVVDEVILAAAVDEVGRWRRQAGSRPRREQLATSTAVTSLGLDILAIRSEHWDHRRPSPRRRKGIIRFLD